MTEEKDPFEALKKSIEDSRKAERELYPREEEPIQEREPEQKHPTKKEYVEAKEDWIEENNKKLKGTGIKLIDLGKYLAWFLAVFSILVVGGLYLTYNGYLTPQTNTTLICKPYLNSTCKPITNCNLSVKCINNCTFNFPDKLKIYSNSS